MSKGDFNKVTGVLRKGGSKNMQQFTGKHSCRSVISIKLLKATLLKLQFGMGVLL